MGIAERSRARVEDVLSDLEGSYDSFPVNQTTLTLPEERYERARREYGEGAVDTYLRIANEDGEVLHVTDDGQAGLPGVVGQPDHAVECDLERRVERQTGVECSVDGLEEVTIAGLGNADAPDDPTYYRLLVVYEASYQCGDLAEGVEWQPGTAEPRPAFV